MPVPSKDKRDRKAAEGYSDEGSHGIRRAKKGAAAAAGGGGVGGQSPPRGSPQPSSSGGMSFADMFEDLLELKY